MGIMILVIGIILACTTLFLAITTVIKGNTKTISIMRNLYGKIGVKTKYVIVLDLKLQCA